MWLLSRAAKTPFFLIQALAVGSTLGSWVILLMDFVLVTVCVCGCMCVYVCASVLDGRKSMHLVLPAPWHNGEDR